MPATIQIGSSNVAAVKEAQYYLVNLLYLPANTAPGVFGPIMMGAVQAFQKMNGLAVDGVIGPNTWAALTSSGAVAANGVPKQYVPTARASGVSAKPSGVADEMTFEPMEIVGRMPSKSWWSSLSPIAKAATATLGLGVGLLVLGGGKGRR